MYSDVSPFVHTQSRMSEVGFIERARKSGTIDRIEY